MVESSGVWNRLDALGPDRVTPGLDRVRALLRRLGEPQLTYPTAVVAGTNGKGSTVAILDAIGRAAGLRTGCYTSPHLEHLEERFKVDGFPISREGLEHHLDTVLAAVDALIADGDLTEHPSYFEVLTAVAFRYFAEARVDLAILEVGLGGRLDATNVTQPRVVVLTAVDIDHVDWLGSDIAGIATEKFGVVPPAGIVVVAEQSPPVLEIVRRLAAERGATVLEASDFPVEVRGISDRLHLTFDMRAKLRTYGGLELGLAGRHQLQNARCAVLAAEVLDRRRMRIGSDAVWAGLRTVRCDGRGHWVDGAPAVLLDGAHNPAAARVLAAYLTEMRDAGGYARLHLIIGAMADKDLAGLAEPLFSLADTLTCTRAPSGRAAAPARLLDAAAGPEDAVAIERPEDALARALERASEDDLVCVTGSLYLIGAVRPLLAPRDD